MKRISVKYDGRYIYSVRPEIVPASPDASDLAQRARHRAHRSADGGTSSRSRSTSSKASRATMPLLYQLPTDAGPRSIWSRSVRTRAGRCRLPIDWRSSLQPDRTTIQLLDVRDPQNVSQAWKLELDGWLRAVATDRTTRCIWSAAIGRDLRISSCRRTRWRSAKPTSGAFAAAGARTVAGLSENGGTEAPLPQPAAASSRNSRKQRKLTTDLAGHHRHRRCARDASRT